MSTSTVNNIGIRMLNPNLRKYLFNRRNKPNKQINEKVTDTLVKFKLLDPNKVSAETEKEKKLASTKPNIEEIELPKLLGKNISEHIEAIANDQTKSYIRLINLFSNQELPNIPSKFSFEPGWTRYDAITGKTTRVEYPKEDALVFDIECLVKYHNVPVMATAVSSKAWYSWCSERLVKNDFMYLKNLGINDLIPMESEDPSVRKSKKRLIIGHNVGFDRSFIKQQYYLEKSGLRFMDTMSMHIACSGFTHEQRDVILSYKSHPNLDPHDVKTDQFDRSVKPGYLWQNKGTLNNLKDVHNFYCPDSKIELEKETRNMFVTGEPNQIIENFQLLMKYCAVDTLATYEVFQKLIATFFNRFEHPATLAGMLEMSTMYLPINKNWLKYIQNCEQAFNDSENLLKKVLERSANEACKFKDQYQHDPWFSQLDWSTKNFNLKKTGIAQVKEKEFFKIMKDDEMENNVFYKISSRKVKNELDQIFYELNPKKVTQKAFMGFNSVPKNLPYLCGYPNWYRDLCSRFDSEDWQPGPSNISTKTRSTPYLLRLTWNEHPMHYMEKLAWGYLIDETEFQKFQDELEKKIQNQMNKNKSYKKKQDPIKVTIGSKTYVYQKIPHKDGEKFNVGNPLAKSFLSKINEKTISSIPDKAAGLALKIHTRISYWEMNLRRIKDQKAIFLDDKPESNGAILPISVVSGTVTRRAVEPTWLTASNYSKDRIGSELKAMIQTPEDYYLVGADVDSQELWIAATLGDSEYKIHGSTPLGWMNLQGKKSDGTDMHSKTASIIGISRDQAKVFNYGRIYGAGKTFAQKLLMQFNPNMSEREAFMKAFKLYAETKGVRKKNKKETVLDESLVKQKKELYPNKTDEEEDVTADKWFGGTESEMFNKLEEIAVSTHPTTPCLNARISQALEPDMVGKYFITSRINWVVQSSAVDYLHIMLVCMNWLIEKYEIDARFAISIHDEIRYIVKEHDKDRAALALQVTNLFTRAMFSYKLGFDDLPMSVAFFSGVDIDKCLRKEPDLDFVSPSNPNGLKHGYKIDFGKCLDIYQIIEKTNGKLSKNC